MSGSGKGRRLSLAGGSAMARRLIRCHGLAAVVGAVLLTMSGCVASQGQGQGDVSAPSASAGSALTATGKPQVLVKKRLTAKSGGIVAASGVALDVPAGAMQADGTGAITAEGRGQFDISLSAPWHGKLRVTIPLASGTDIVMHQVAGTWIPEGSVPGQSTVTVTHLSLFAPLSSLGRKLSSALCLKQNPLKLLNCLVGKGIVAVDKAIVQALLGKAVDKCQAALLAQAESGSGGAVAVSVLVKIFTGPCVGQAGEGNWSPPVTSTPSMPANGGPIQGGSPSLQGGSPPLQGGSTPPPAPTSPAPVPAGSGRILIDPCLNLRAGPDGKSNLVGCIPKDTVIAIDCTAQGNSVTGPYGATTLWDHTTYNGVSGYVSDAWVYTGKSGAVAGSC